MLNESLFTSDANSLSNEAQIFHHKTNRRADRLDNQQHDANDLIKRQFLPRQQVVSLLAVISRERRVHRGRGESHRAVVRHDVLEVHGLRAAQAA